MNQNQVVRKPVQARSIARYEKILDATEELILETGVDSTSHHRIAERAQVPSASVYQYFPSRDLIFQALSERHFEKVLALFEQRIENANVSGWQDLAELMVNMSFEFYTTDPIAEQLFLGVHTGTNVRKGAASRLTAFAEWYAPFFGKIPGLQAVPELEEKLAISVNITDAAFVRSLSLHNRITSAYRDEAIRAVTGYLGSYFTH